MADEDWEAGTGKGSTQLIGQKERDRWLVAASLERSLLAKGQPMEC